MKCYRGVCNAQDANCLHTHNNQLYCPACARGINEFNPGLVLFPIDPVKELIRIRDTGIDSDQMVKLSGLVPFEDWKTLLALRPNTQDPIPHGSTTKMRIMVEVEISSRDVNPQDVFEVLDCRCLSNAIGASVTKTTIIKLLEGDQ
jgi:hypothetical protein